MFKGSFVALVTPMNEDDSIDFHGLESLIDLHINSGTNGFVIMGTTAESATLEFVERIEIVKFAIEHINLRCPDRNSRPKIIVGNGSNCTRHSVERTQELELFDIDGYLAVVPYYNKPSQNGLIAHFKALAECTDKPILLYNVPGRTVVDLIPESVASLAKVDNIIGIKEASGQIERVREIKQLCGEDFVCLSGDDASSLDFMKAGGDGYISVTANVAPKQMAQMCQASFDKDWHQADKINQQLLMLHEALFIEPNPVPAKWVLAKMGLINSPQLRLPLIPLEPIHQNAVKEAMLVAGLI